MTQETLMSSETANTSEGQAASQAAASESTQQVGEQVAAEVNAQQATEGQTADGEKTEGGESEGEQAKPEGAPEQYEFKAPEGQEFDPAVIDQFSEIAKELNLPQDAAQKILDKMGPTIATRQAEAIEAARTEWANASQTDKEFGGEKLTENLSVAKKALDSFGTPELRTLLNQSGLGNHPEVIRFMYRAGKAISDDSFVSGSQATASKRTADVLYNQ